jgi:hypothetical protein
VSLLSYSFPRPRDDDFVGGNLKGVSENREREKREEGEREREREKRRKRGRETR